MNNQNTKSTRENHSEVALASIWLLLLALAVVVELVSLLMSHSMLAAIH
jgi:hypothetical protein